MARNETLTAVGSGVEESEWRSLHPITPLARTWTIFAAIIAFIFFQNAQFLYDIAELGLVETYGIAIVLFAIAAGILLFILVTGIYSWFAWKRMGFAITSEAVFFREGIFFRRQKHARLDRIQAVNITHPLIGRIFKLGNIDVEVAGGAGSNFKLGLLKTAQLEEVRREVMLRARQAKGQIAAPAAQAGGTLAGAGVAGVSGQGSALPGSGLAGSGLPGGAEAGLGGPQMGQMQGAVAPAPGTDISMMEFDELENIVFKVPTGRLLASVVVNGGSLLLGITGAAMILGTVIPAVMFPTVGAAVLPAVIGGIAMFTYPFNQFSMNYGFTASVTSDGIRVRSGLLSTRAQTIPIQRIHGIKVRQPFFWRYFGWYKVEIVQAGFAPTGKEDKVNHSVLLPVGEKHDMLRALWMVYPNLGVPNPVEVINAGLTSEGEMLGFSQNPPSSKIFDPLVWKRRAVRLTDEMILLRDGRITRKFTMLPYDHLQSTRISQGPWERRRGLATVSLHLVQVELAAGIRHLGAAQAEQVHTEITRRARLTRTHETQEEWVRRAAPAASEQGTAYTQQGADAQGQAVGVPTPNQAMSMEATPPAQSPLDEPASQREPQNEEK
ncbi:MAG: PH domain-containing protein [Actinomycetaceae bacterium]|nr:PH domain-containing protein [Actinomycetaceae bacterium]